MKLRCMPTQGHGPPRSPREVVEAVERLLGRKLTGPGDVTRPLLEAALSWSTLRKALRRVNRNRRRNGKAPLPQALEDTFRSVARVHTHPLRQQWVAGQYLPAPLRSARVSMADGSFREIRLPDPVDSVLLTALQLALVEVVDPWLSRSAFGFRRGVGSLHAVARAHVLARRFGWAHRADVRRCFDRLDHERVALRLLEATGDPVLALQVQRMLGTWNPAGVGVPTGIPLAPVLCNLCLAPVDEELEDRGFPFARYADDMASFHRTRAEAEKAGTILRRALEKVGLEPGRGPKTSTGPSTAVEFSGYMIHPLLPRQENLQRYLEGLREEPCAGRRIHRAQGWIGYFALCPSPAPFRLLDELCGSNEPPLLPGFSHLEEWARLRGAIPERRRSNRAPRSPRAA